jgi:hypothetical protein
MTTTVQSLPRWRGSHSAWTETLVPALALGVVGLYIARSAITGTLGFPLDDSWIHQVYARNLALRGEFAFLPGVPSAGSTAPLWTVLLAVAYWLGIDPRFWAYLLGALTLGLCAVAAGRLATDLLPRQAVIGLLAGVLVALEWHLGWAAASGMETVLQALFALVAFVIPTRQPLALGAWIGASLFVRPDGALLGVFALARMLSDSRAPVGASDRTTDSSRPAPALTNRLFGRSRLRALGLLAGGFLLMAVPYVSFNLWLTGTPWPNTFYAKQAEYAELQAYPIWERLFYLCTSAGCNVGLAVVPWVGAQALILPGLLRYVYLAVRERQWVRLLPLAWAAALIFAYALRLPVTYQYGRYVMPVIPVLIVCSLVGLVDSFSQPNRHRIAWVIKRVWALSTAVVALFFVAVGSGRLANDVAWIEANMVATALWVQANTAPGDLIAAHDIGALGYHAERRILDTAGLISPEVIPFIRDEAQLEAWMRDRGAVYFVSPPGFYPALDARLAPMLVFAPVLPEGVPPPPMQVFGLGASGSTP